jgi:hypothetical protein
MDGCKKANDGYVFSSTLPISWQNVTVFLPNFIVVLKLTTISP